MKHEVSPGEPTEEARLFAKDIKDMSYDELQARLEELRGARQMTPGRGGKKRSDVGSGAAKPKKELLPTPKVIRI